MTNINVRQQIVIFSLTFISYALYHAARKTLSGVKSTITYDWLGNGTSIKYHEPLFRDQKSAQDFLAALDAIFMICYAVALVFWGWLGDRFNPRSVVVFGMIGSAITLTLFGAVPYWLNFYSIPWYVVTYIAFGIVQACGFPNEVAIMANWFPEHNRGFVMGMWAACQPLGNILGALLISLILPTGYQMTFAWNSLFVFIGAIFMLLFVTPKPPPSPTADEYFNNGRGANGEREQLLSRAEDDSLLDQDHPHPPPPPTRGYYLEYSAPLAGDGANGVRGNQISLFQALCLPSVLPYCLCNACLKFVNYAFFFWLPLYLHLKYQWPENFANQISIWYDVGGIFGSVLGGIASDRLGHRCPVLMVMLVVSLPLLFVYAGVGSVQALHVLFMGLLGFTISGPYNLIVGTIAIDLGSQPALAGNAEAMSTVTGLIDGTGSTGSAIGQLFIPTIQNTVGWEWVFYLFIAMNALSALCLMRRFIQDVRIIWRSRFIEIQNSSNGSGRRRTESEPLLSPSSPRNGFSPTRSHEA